MRVAVGSAGRWRLAGHHFMARDDVKWWLVSPVGLAVRTRIGMPLSIIGGRRRIVGRIVGSATHRVIWGVLGFCG